MPDNLLSMLRLRNIFGGGDMIGNDLPSQGGFTGNMNPFDAGQISSPSIQSPTVSDTGMPDATGTTETTGPTMTGAGTMEDMVNRMYKPKTDAQQKMDTLLSQYPEREKPSVMRRIGSALVGYQYGPQEQQNFLNRPFTQKLQDWQNQIGPVERAAGIERQSNVNERTLAMQTVANQLRTEAEQHRVEKNERDAANKEHRANVYEFKARNPGMKLAFPKGGNIQAIDPITGEPKDTGIPTGSLSDADKLALQEQSKQADIKTTGEETRKTEDERQKGRMAVVGAKGAESRKTKETTPGKAGGSDTKSETPVQTRIRQFNNARQVFNSRPDLRQFVKVGQPGSTDFQVTPPGTNFFGSATGPTKEQYDEINNLIYGGQQTQIPQPGRTGASTTPKSTVSGRRVTVIDVKTGKPIATVPEEDKDKIDTTKYRIQ